MVKQEGLGGGMKGCSHETKKIKVKDEAIKGEQCHYCVFRTTYVVASHVPDFDIIPSLICKIEYVKMLGRLAGWSEVAVYHGLATFSTLYPTSETYLPFSGECPWAWRTDLSCLYARRLIYLYHDPWHISLLEASLAALLVTKTYGRSLMLGVCHLTQIRFFPGLPSLCISCTLEQS